jgi:hypothetical protein
VSVAGLIVRVAESAWFIPAERVGFVTPLREIRDGGLVMPRGILPLVDPAPGSGGARKAAVAIRIGGDFVALAVDRVDLADSGAAAEALPISAIEEVLASGARPPA